MKRNQLFVIPVFAALAAAALPAAAWDNAGHSQIADIAWTKLNAATKREIGKILAAGEPKFRPTGASESSIRDAFRKTATFPDYIKGNRNTIYKSMIPTMNGLFFKTAPPNPQDNEDKLCKTWHYYDVPLNDVSGHTPKELNALAALTRTQQQLGQLENTSRPIANGCSGGYPGQSIWWATCISPCTAYPTSSICPMATKAAISLWCRHRISRVPFGCTATGMAVSRAQSATTRAWAKIQP